MYTCECTFYLVLFRRTIFNNCNQQCRYLPPNNMTPIEFSGEWSQPTENAETSMEGAARRPPTTPTAHPSPPSHTTVSFPSCTKASSTTPVPRPAAATATRGALPGPIPSAWATAAMRSATARGETVFAALRYEENCEIVVYFMRGEPPPTLMSHLSPPSYTTGSSSS